MATNHITYGQLVNKMKELGTLKQALSWLNDQFDSEKYNKTSVRAAGQRILKDYKQKNKTKGLISQDFFL